MDDVTGRIIMNMSPIRQELISERVYCMGTWYPPREVEFFWRSALSVSWRIREGRGWGSWEGWRKRAGFWKERQRFWNSPGWIWSWRRWTVFRWRLLFEEKPAAAWFNRQRIQVAQGEAFLQGSYGLLDRKEKCWKSGILAKNGWMGVWRETGLEKPFIFAFKSIFLGWDSVDGHPKSKVQSRVS